MIYTETTITVMCDNEDCDACLVMTMSTGYFDENDIKGLVLASGWQPGPPTICPKCQLGHQATLVD